MAMESGTINEGQYKRRMKEMRGSAGTGDRQAPAQKGPEEETRLTLPKSVCDHRSGFRTGPTGTVCDYDMRGGTGPASALPISMTNVTARALIKAWY